MLKDITIGQHFPGNSPVHRCDPRLKILLVIAYIVILFTVTNFLGLALSILLLALFGSEVINLSLLDLRALGIFALALAALRIFKPDPIWVMAGAGVLGGILYSL